jgi:uncharacterized Zn-binding protein involved in type VI secretion
MPFAARVNDPTSHGPPLNPGPGSLTVQIGFMKAWRALPSSVGGAMDAISNAMQSFMTKPMMTPTDAASDLIKISQNLVQGGAKAAAAAAPAAAGAAASQVGTLVSTNIALTTTWASASVVPGGQPAANIAYTEGIKAAAAAAASATVSAMAGLADMHICPIPCPIPPHGPGFVTKGSSSVLIDNLPPARQGDKVMEACGGADPIAMGCPTVDIGDGGGGGGGGAGGAAAGAAAPPAYEVTEETSGGLLGAIVGGALGFLVGGAPGAIVGAAIGYALTSETVTRYGDNIVIHGSPEYRATVVSDLNQLNHTPTGQALLQNINNGTHEVAIQPMQAGQAYDNGFCRARDYGAATPQADGTPGAGSDSDVFYNPTYTQTYTAEDGTTQTQPPHDVLGHELMHATHNSAGNNRAGDALPSPYSNVEEAQTIGVQGRNDAAGHPVIPNYSGAGTITERNLSADQGRAARPNHNAITSWQNADGTGQWYSGSYDAAGNTVNTPIPAPNGRPVR